MWGLSLRHLVDPPCGAKNAGSAGERPPWGCFYPNWHQEASWGGQHGWVWWTHIWGMRRGTTGDWAGASSTAG